MISLSHVAPTVGKVKKLISDFGCLSHIICDRDSFDEIDDVSSKTCVSANTMVSAVKLHRVAKFFSIDE